MEKLNEYLQTLLSTCSYELRLEPNKNPYIVNSGGNSDVTNTPLPGTQIGMMIFPLIPADVKQELPNQSEIEFVFPHRLGEFRFHITKSPNGFIVSVKPIISQPKLADNDCDDEFIEAATPKPAVISEKQPQIEVVSVYDPEFQTVFSDESTYEPPLKKSEFAPVTVSETISGANNLKAPQFTNSPVNQTSPVETETSPPENNSMSQSNNSQPPLPNNNFNPSNQPRPQSPAALNQPPRAAVQPMNQPPRTMPPVQRQPMPPQQMQMPPIIQPPTSIAAPPQFSPAAVNPQAKSRMDALFHKMAEEGASDLHMSVSMPPMIRKDGKIMQLKGNESTLSAEAMRELLTSIMPAKNQEEFARRNDSDFAYEIPNLARFRANIFADRKGMGGVFRIIPTKILTAEQLGLSDAIMNLCELSKGLVVVTGPTGSGKSTTLCAMVDSINKKREDHIITIEDPIEFTHENQKCLVNQREVHNHTDSFKDALRAALREDPDILLVGEMRDLETISIAIETAETGHLVFGTLHTTTAASTVDRIIDQFPADRQQQIRVMLSESLRGVIAQTLLPKKGGGRVAALEVLIVTPAISNLIREGKTFQIPSAMQTGKNLGMVMLNDALFALVQKGLVEPRDAYIKSVDKNGFEMMLTRGGFKI